MMRCRSLAEISNTARNHILSGFLVFSRTVPDVRLGWPQKTKMLPYPLCKVLHDKPRRPDAALSTGHRVRTNCNAALPSATTSANGP